MPNTEVHVASAPQPPTATPTAPLSKPTAATSTSASPESLWKAANSGDVDALKAALAGNVDLEAHNPEGDTALIIAIKHNHVDMVKALLAHGASPDTPDARGFTPIRTARWGNREAIVSVLEKKIKRH